MYDVRKVRNWRLSIKKAYQKDLPDHLPFFFAKRLYYEYFKGFYNEPILELNKRVSKVVLAGLIQEIRLPFSCDENSCHAEALLQQEIRPVDQGYHRPSHSGCIMCYLWNANLAHSRAFCVECYLRFNVFYNVHARSRVYLDTIKAQWSCYFKESY